MQGEPIRPPPPATLALLPALVEHRLKHGLRRYLGRVVARFIGFHFALVLMSPKAFKTPARTLLMR
jgi:hypothetical protein